ncbi:MAG: hypothetical protein ABI560_09605 [Myxococcales bacterium]
MTGNLVVHFERKTYLVTPTQQTRRLAGRRREVIAHNWPDGRMEIRHAGQSLPFHCSENHPYVSAGDVVEQKRVDEVMELIRQAQETDQSVRLTEPRRPLVLGVRKPPRRSPIKAPPTVIGVRPPDLPGQDSPRDRFVLRWVRKQAFLYERSLISETVGGHPWSRTST